MQSRPALDILAKSGIELGCISVAFCLAACGPDGAPGSDNNNSTADNTESSSQSQSAEDSGSVGDSGDSGSNSHSTGDQDSQTGDFSTSNADDQSSDSGEDQDGDCPAELTQVAFYQTVKSTVMLDMQEGEREVDVIADRQAFVRVFIRPRSGKFTVDATLTLTTGGSEETFEATLSADAASSDESLDSTLNFRVPAAAIGADTTYVVELKDGGRSLVACDNARWPATGDADLATRKTGVVKVMLVPIKSTTNGGSANTSQELQDAFASEVMAMYPTSAVEIQMHDEVSTDIDIGKGFDTWEDLLGELRELKQNDGLASEIHYYGLLAPEGSGGAGGLAGPGWGQKEGGIGCGLGTDPSFHDWIFAHELGHMHSRLHAPCGGAQGVDEDYPYTEADIGTWGMDLRSEDLKAPGLSDREKISDVMSYCQPSWISDYQYNALADYVEKLAYRLVPATNPRMESFRMLIVNARGESRWSRPIARIVSDEDLPERAQVLDEYGNVITEVGVFRMDLSDSGATIFDVPEASVGWHTIRIPDGSELAFSLPPRTQGMRATKQ